MTNNKSENGKVVCIDWSAFLHMSAHASVKLSMTASYLAMTMILGNLKKIGLDPWDDVIVCCDYGHSWRKDYEPEYKANRKEARDKSPVDFDLIFAEFNDLLEKVERGTDWHVIKIDRVEADDIMAVSARYYKDKEVILLTADSDMEQLWEYNNVKIFSPHRLMKRYKIKPPKFNVSHFLAKKAHKEVADNLISPILNEEDYETRMICVNLLELPEWVEESITQALENLKPKEYIETGQLPGDVVERRYNELYNDRSKIITYAQCVKKQENKKRRKKCNKK